MRYVSTNHLKPGDKLGADLATSRNRVLLRKGRELSHTMINKLEVLGFQGVYVDDKISDGIVVDDIISHELKSAARAEMQALFHNGETNRHHNVRKQMPTIKSIVHNIVDEVVRNHDIMVNIIDIRTYDDYTYSHSLNVSVLSVVMGTVLGLGKKQLHDLAMGSLLHDTGKMFIKKEILNKPARLTPEEFEEIKTHSERGYHYLCDQLEIPEEARIVALQHHEQFSGNGYPAGLSNTDIHLYGRICCVADVYDALTSDRPYRKSMPPSDAIEYIMSGYNTLFDPIVVEALTKKIAPYPAGTCVRLSTGQTGIVVQNYQETGLRPRVRLIANGEPTTEYIDLAHDMSALNITIDSIVNE
jgi:HD-GYP domain-containing protein (c-di-GMP phosphodiesterase class II)